MVHYINPATSRSGPTPWLVTRYLILFYFFLIPLHSVIVPLANLLFWQIEYQADAFAVRLGYGPALCSGLVKLHNGRMLAMDPLFEVFYLDHPSVVDRVVQLGCYPASH